MTRLPKLPVRVQIGGGLAKSRDHVAELISAGVESVAASLGVALRPAVEVVDGDGLPVVSINGEHAHYSHREVIRARMFATQRLLASDDADAAGRDLVRTDLPAELRARWLAALIQSIVIARPQLLVTNAVIVAAAQEIGKVLNTSVKWTVLGPLLRGALAHGLSVASLSSRIGLMQAALAAPGQDAVEQVVSGLHPQSVITLWLNSRDLERMLRHDGRADARPLAVIHERARAELGLPLPAIKLRLDDTAEGSYCVQINHLRELRQPLLPAGQSLVPWGDGEMVYVVSSRAPACVVSSHDRSSPSSFAYLAQEVFDTVATRAPRLIEREGVARMCMALGKPSLYALAVTSEHYQDLPRVLRTLLAEYMSIRDLGTILARLIDHYEVDTPPPRTHLVLSQAFPVSHDLPPKETRIVEAVRLAVRARLTPMTSSSLRVVLLTPVLERELMADQSPPWREDLVDEIAARDFRGADAILTTLELRPTVRALAERSHPELAVLSFQELASQTPVVRVGTIDLPAGAGARPRTTAPAQVQVAPEIAEGFGLLLADGKLGLPALAELVPDRFPPSDPPDAPHRVGTVARDPLAKPDSLAHQGWAILIPATAHGEAMRRAIEPLERYRCDVQAAAPFEVFKITAEYSKRPRLWIQDRFEALPQLQRPRYVLILGDFSDVSLELQLALSPLASVGRLAFDSYAAFTAYAEKAVKAETDATVETIRPVVFMADDDGAATRIARNHLMAPSVEAIHALARDPKRRIEPIHVVEGGKAELLAAARNANFLFTACHGAGGKMSYADRRALQGALLTRPNQFMTADDVSAHPFLPNGAWFMLACYGAGTPRISSYADWIEELYRSNKMREHMVQIIDAGTLAPDEEPFVAALPRIALANPAGPLVVIGHVDLAWSYSFTHNGQSRFDQLFSAMRVLLHGRLAGLALEQIAYKYLAVCDHLGDLYAHYKVKDSGPEVDARDLSRVYMLRQDLRNYILLGDPAARIKLTERRS